MQIVPKLKRNSCSSQQVVDHIWLKDNITSTNEMSIESMEIIVKHIQESNPHCSVTIDAGSSQMIKTQCKLKKKKEERKQIYRPQNASKCPEWHIWGIGLKNRKYTRKQTKIKNIIELW